MLLPGDRAAGVPPAAAAPLSALTAILRHARKLDGQDHVSRRWRFLRRSFRAPRALAAYIGFLEGYRDRHGLGPLPRTALEIAGRQYMIFGLRFPERFALARRHHEAAARVLTRDTLVRLWAGEDVGLGALPGRSGQAYRLCLDGAACYPSEGELSFGLCDAGSREVLARLTFLIAETPAGRSLLVGGLQGPRVSGDAKGRIVRATRDLQGLRPKMAVFLAACAFAAAIGASRIYAVGNDTHVVRGRRAARRSQLRADYDGFWLERSGVPNRFGFELPVETESRPGRAKRNVQRLAIEARVAAVVTPGG